jgi:hypothetical protein
VITKSQFSSGEVLMFSRKVLASIGSGRGCVCGLVIDRLAIEEPVALFLRLFFSPHRPPWSLMPGVIKSTCSWILEGI